MLDSTPIKFWRRCRGLVSKFFLFSIFFLLICLVKFEAEEETMADNNADNNQRTLRDLIAPDVNQQPLYIVYPNLNVGFELKFGLIHLLPKFHGLENEDPNKHLKEFHIVCSSMKPQGVSEEQIKLRAFPFSLEGKAKDWLFYLPSSSINV